MGGDYDSYNSNGYNKFSIRELTSPVHATANLCKMNWIPPFVIAGTHNGFEKDMIHFYSEEYKKMIVGLRDDDINLTKYKDCEVFNQELYNKD